MGDKKDVISPAQCRAARGLVNLSQASLAAAADVSEATVANFEREARTPYSRTLRDMRAALEARGIIFVDENGDGAGVRLRKESK